MTKLTLFMELLDVIKELLETGATSTNIYGARLQMDTVFNKFELFDDMELSQLDRVLDKISVDLLEMPSELKAYFKWIENAQAENEIYPHDLPNVDNSFEAAQFVSEFMDILNQLLHAGITPCTSHEAHMKLDDLFKRFEQQAEADEDMAINEYLDTPNALAHFFPDLQEQMDSLTLFLV